MIRDRLVVGVNDVNIQRKLLSEVGLTLERALAIAVGIETATKEAAAMSAHVHGGSSIPELHNVDSGKPSRERCFRCGDMKHKQQNCFFKEKECFTCKKKGHISKVCMGKKKSARETCQQR